MTLPLLGTGGFFGAVARYLVDGWVSRLTGAGFPWGTVEFVDVEEKVRAALPEVESRMDCGLVALDPVELLKSPGRAGR